MAKKRGKSDPKAGKPPVPSAENGANLLNGAQIEIGENSKYGAIPRFGV
jgi:hypothetical protein